MKKRLFSSALLLVLTVSGVHAQSDSEAPLSIFGYFQNSFSHQTKSLGESDRNSFNLQQLNLFFQKELSRNWRAFVNFEFVNTFSSSRQWGSANLEEAWAAYSPNENFNLKLGLLLPIFNNLNTIKNRTPILPYVIRPLAYETSFQDFIPVEDFAPSRAFAQAYGFLPFRGMKLDYAAYLGNSPNIASLSSADDANQQTGVDTTNTFLVGGRIGLSYFDDFKIGFSMTYDKTNFFEAANQLIFQSSNKLLLGTNSDFGNVPRKRYGGDLSFRYKNIAFESEIIKVQHDEDIQNADLDRDFFYITLGYRFKERLFVYASYWDVRLDYTVATVLKDEVQVFVVDGDIILPNFGIAYSVNDRITLKAHIARADLAEDIPFLELFEKDKFYHLNAAISIFF